MSSIARHVSTSTIKSTNRRINQRARRRAVRRFTTVWAERVARYDVPLTIAAGALGGAVLLTVGYIARLWIEGVI